jgi:hypothetical protein
MGKQVTKKKRAFAKHYAQTGDVTASALAAGYAYPQPCWRFIKKDEHGVILDEVFRAMLIEYGADGVKSATNLAKEKPPAPVISMMTRREVQPVDYDQPPTLNSMLRTMADLARDDSFPAGPRVQVMMFLVRHLQAEQAEDEQPDEQVLAEVKLMLGIVE